MKKICFLLIAFCFIQNQTFSQVKSYQYPSGTLNEKTINAILDNSKNEGTQEWELQLLKKHLYQRMKAQTKGEQQKAAIPNQVMQACTNVDFEQGNYTGWTLTSGNINAVNLPCNTCPNVAGGIANITTAYNSGPTWTNGIDGCSHQPVVAPGGGNYSLCLNNATAGGKMEMIQQTFVVTPSNAIYTYQYLAVLQDGGHPANEQPYFLCQMLDGSGNLIPCAYYIQSAASSITGWVACPGCAGSNYKGWIGNTVDLTPYIGQNVTIQFLVSDCNQGGHYGYAYIDGSCGILQINAPNTTICAGSSGIWLYAPSNLTSYNWSGPGIVGSTTNSSVFVNTAGVYSVTVSGSCTSNYTTTLTQTVTVSSSASPTVSIAGNDTICSGHSTLLTASGASSYTWSANAGSVITNTVSVSPTTNVSYNVVGADTSGCSNTTNIIITVHPAPSLTISASPNDSICFGNSVTLNSTGAQTYTWSNGVSNGVAFTPTVTTTYVLIGTNNVGCSSTDSINIVVNSCTTGLNQLNYNTQFVIYPNPADNNITIQSSSELGAITIYNSLGEKVIETRAKSQETKIDISNLAAGVYTVQTQGKYIKLIKE